MQFGQARLKYGRSTAPIWKGFHPNGEKNRSYRLLKECDGRDRVKEGIIESSTSCHFDRVVLRCKSEDDVSCLKAPQVEFLRLTYAGPINPRTNKRIYSGARPRHLVCGGGS
jgi:hypothetical protein